MDGVFRRISLCDQIQEGNTNIVTDALSRRHTLISILSTRLMGFYLMIDLYKEDLHFAKIYEECAKGAKEDYFRHEGFLF